MKSNKNLLTKNNTASINLTFYQNFYKKFIKELRSNRKKKKL